MRPRQPETYNLLINVLGPDTWAIAQRLL